MTITSIDADAPPGLHTFKQLRKLPHTFTAAHIASGLGHSNNLHGAKIADLRLQTATAFASGTGGSFILKLTISGRPAANPEGLECNLTCTLRINTSEWGKVARPGSTTFAWTLDDLSIADASAPDEAAAIPVHTYTAPTPSLGYLQKSCITFTYDAESAASVFVVSNQDVGWALPYRHEG